MRTRLSVLMALTFLTHVCLGQTNDRKNDSNWGSEVNGVRLSISLTNNLIDVGSNSILSANVTNCSTNSIILIILDPRNSDFNVYLTGDSLGKHTLVQPSGARWAVFPPIKIDSKDSHQWVIPFKIGKDIEPGNYLLSASRNFREAGVFYTLESNAIKVQIK